MILGDQEQIGAEIRDNLNIQGEGGEKGSQQSSMEVNKKK